jgi:hypothetical protein
LVINLIHRERVECGVQLISLCIAPSLTTIQAEGVEQIEAY